MFAKGCKSQSNLAPVQQGKWIWQVLMTNVAHLNLRTYLHNKDKFEFDFVKQHTVTLGVVHKGYLNNAVDDIKDWPNKNNYLKLYLFQWFYYHLLESTCYSIWGYSRYTIYFKSTTTDITFILHFKTLWDRWFDISLVKIMWNIYSIAHHVVHSQDCKHNDALMTKVCPLQSWKVFQIGCELPKKQKKKGNLRGFITHEMSNHCFFLSFFLLYLFSVSGVRT